LQALVPIGVTVHRAGRGSFWELPLTYASSRIEALAAKQQKE
jgi:hypothetical protein